MRSRFFLSVICVVLPVSAWIPTSSEAGDAVYRAVGLYQPSVTDVFTDDATGVKLSIPTSLFNPPRIERWGRSWTTSDHRISVDTLNFGNTETIDNWVGKLVNKSNRIITKRVVDKNSFVLEGRDVGRQAGTDSLFHVEAHVHNAEIRGLSIVYSASVQKELAPAVQSIISSLNPFPNRLIAAAPKESTSQASAGTIPLAGTSSPAISGSPQTSVEKVTAQVQKKQQEVQHRVDDLAAATKTGLPNDDMSKELARTRDENTKLLAMIEELKKPRQATRPQFKGTRVALVIGNNAYPNLPSDRQLTRAVSDSRTMGDVLEDIGFKVIRGENLDRQTMLDRLQEFFHHVNKGDMALIFFAGHGVSLLGGNHLLPSDVKLAGSQQESFARSMAIAESDVLADLQEREPAVAVLMLDACRDNPFRQPGLRSVTGENKGLLRGVEGKGVFAVYSAGAGQSAIDNLGPTDKSPNSIFTRVMAVQLYREDRLSEIMTDVQQEVAALARSVGGQQNPAYYDQTENGPLYIAATLPPGTPKGIGGPRASGN